MDTINNDDKSFLVKHLNNWNDAGNPQSALVLLAEDADGKIGVEITPELRKAASSVIADTHRKAVEAVRRDQTIRAVILCIRGMKASQRLGNGLDGAFRELLAENLAKVLGKDPVLA
jgi:hypothetical protein